MASSSGSRRYDVFPSFSGADVRKGFLSYLLKEFKRKAINSFIDNGIERSRPISPELILAIREARISIVIFSKNYAASTWCLNELLEIHKSSRELNQMVIPVFYEVDPSNVRKQTREFGKVFEETCKGKQEDHIQKWKQALTDVANLAGEDLSNWPTEADMVEKIANDVSNKLITSSTVFGDSVGIEAHIKAMKSILCLESEEPRMIGIWGQSGIGKSTLGRSLFSHISPNFHFRNFSTDKPMDKDIFGMKLKWEKKFLSEILGQKDLKIDNFGEVKKRLNSKKVLIVLDDVVNPEFLETLVGKNEWFGSGSRIIVITQDRHILKAHKIDLLYEVKIPDEDIAIKMLCLSAFGEISPPDDFKELAVKVAKVAGNLPLGLRVLGSSLKGRTKEEWMKLLPGLQNGLKSDIMRILKVSYDRLDEKEQDIFLYIASLFNGWSVKCINDFFGDNNGCVEIMLRRLAEKSLIRTLDFEEIYSLDVLRKRTRPNEEIVEMHNLLEKLGKEIVRAESKSNPGKRRFLTDATEIEKVFTHQTGTETVLGIIFDESTLKSPISIDENSLKGMSSIQYLQIYTRLNGSQLNLVYLPPKLKWLVWYCCPSKCLPSNFKAEFLIELRMEESNLEKLWEGTQQLGSLKTIMMRSSYYLKEIPDLSQAISLERVDFSLSRKLESFPSHLNLESLEYLNLQGCRSLKNFPHIKMESLPHGIEISVFDSLWNKNLPGLDYLDCLKRCYPPKFLPEHLVSVSVMGSTMEKLWEGIQSLGSLQRMNLFESEKLKEIPDLSKATNLTYLNLSYCKSLVTLPFTIGNLQKLEKLEMEKCTGLEVLPVDLNLSSLRTLKLNGCSSLKSFPHISRSIQYLYLNDTAIGEVPCLIEMLPRLIEFSMCGCSSLTSFPLLSSSIEKLSLDDTAIEEVPYFIEMFRRLTRLSMRGCSKLKNISPNIFKLKNLKQVDFTGCVSIITTLNDGTVVATIEDSSENIEKKSDEEDDENKEPDEYFNFGNCLKLDRDAREHIIQSSLKSTVILPGGEMPLYFNSRAFGNSLIVTLPQSSLSHKFLRFNVCLVVKPLSREYRRLQLRFNGVCYEHYLYVDMQKMWKTDHLVLCSFKIQPAYLSSRLDFNEVEFKFRLKEAKVYDFKFKDSSRMIKEVGIRVLNVSTSLDDRDERSSETECNNHSGEKCDVIETERSKKRMRMTSLTLPHRELPLGRGESSSVSSYPCLQGEDSCIASMIIEHQDALIPIARLDPKPDLTWWPSCSESSTSSPSSTSWASSTSSTSSERASIFSCWRSLLEKIKGIF